MARPSLRHESLHGTVEPEAHLTIEERVHRGCHYRRLAWLESQEEPFRVRSQAEGMHQSHISDELVVPLLQGVVSGMVLELRKVAAMTLPLTSSPGRKALAGTAQMVRTFGMGSVNGSGGVDLVPAGQL